MTLLYNMLNGLTQISQNFQGKRRNTCKECLQNFMGIDQKLNEKSAKNTQRWWKLSATIYLTVEMTNKKTMQNFP